jgi:C_GCAxxG_C_C family probable redox protein
MKTDTARAQRAKALFQEGYNCAQAVLLAFGDVTGLPDATAAKLASGFGGGIGRMREVCGAVSGAVMAMSLARGYDDPKASDAKAAHYKLVQAFAAKFKEENGSIICRELLQDVPTTPGTAPEARTEAFYRKRPCAELVVIATAIAEEMLSEDAGRAAD